MTAFDLDPTADGIVFAIHALTHEWLTAPAPRPHDDVIAQIEAWIGDHNRAKAAWLEDVSTF